MTFKDEVRNRVSPKDISGIANDEIGPTDSREGWDVVRECVYWPTPMMSFEKYENDIWALALANMFRFDYNLGGWITEMCGGDVADPKKFKSMMVKAAIEQACWEIHKEAADG